MIEGEEKKGKEAEEKSIVDVMSWARRKASRVNPAFEY